MEILLIIAFGGFCTWWLAKQRQASKARATDLSMLPPTFVVFDLETTGLESARHEIIEIGAIRVNRDFDTHTTFRTLVIPQGRLSARITQLTGITRELIDRDGIHLRDALAQFRDFVGDLPLVSYNSEFDGAFLHSACKRALVPIFQNDIWCALKMARRAWPGRRSYRLSDLARDGGLSIEDAHRALGDCKRTMFVYVAAAQTLGTFR